MTRPFPRSIAVTVLLCVIAVPPLFAAGLELSPLEIGPTAYPNDKPAIATLGANSLVAWRLSGDGSLLGGDKIMVMLTDAGGRPLWPAAREVVTTGFVWSEPLLVARANDYLLAWDELSTGVNLATFSPEGELTSHRILTVGSALKMMRWSAGHLLIVDHNTIWVIDENGVAVDSHTRPDATPVDAIVAGDEVLLLASSGNPVLYRYRRGQWAARSTTALTIEWNGSRLLTRGDDVLLVTTRLAPAELRVGVVEGTAAREVASLPLVGMVNPRIHVLLRTGDGAIAIVRGESTASSRNTLFTAVRIEASGDIKAPAVNLVETPADQFFYGPSFAWGAQRLLAATRTADYPVTAWSFDPSSFELGDRNVVALTPARETTPFLLARGSEFFATWTAASAGAQQIRVAKIAGGTIAERRTVAAVPSAYHVVAGEGPTETVIFWGGPFRASFMRVTHDGAPLDPQPRTIGAEGSATAVSALWTGNHYLMTWIADGRLWVTTLTSGGVVSEPLEIRTDQHVPPDWRRAVFGAAAVMTHDGPLIVFSVAAGHRAMMPPSFWTEERVFALRLDHAGNARDAAPLQVSADGSTPAVASSGFDALVTWTSKDVVRAAYLTLSQGGITSGSAHEVFSWFNAPVPAVAWNGREYEVAVRYGGSRDSAFVAFQRYAPGEPLRFVRTGPAESSIIQIAAGVSRTLVGLSEVRHGSARAVVYDRGEFAPMPALPSAPVSVAVVPVSNGRVEVSWTAPLNEPVEGFVVEALSYGSAWRAVAIEGGNATSTVIRDSYPQPAVYRVRSFNARGLSDATGTMTPARRRAARAR